MRRWILPIAIVALLWVVVARRADLDELGRTLALGRWPWIAAAAGLQAAYYLLYAALVRESFRVVGVPGGLRHTLAVLLASMFVNVVVPSAGAAGAALFVDDAARRGHSPARAAAGLTLAMTAVLSALALVLAGSVAGLAARHELRPLEAWGAAALFAMDGALLLLLALALRWPGVLGALLRGLERAAAAALRRLGRADAAPAGWAGRTAAEFVEVARALRARPAGPAGLLGLALLTTLLDASTLGVLFLAFGEPLRPGVVVVGYAFGIATWLISPIPQGIGMVEGVMAVVYASLGVRAEPATLVVLSFRGLTFWLPMLAGFALLRGLPSLRKAA